LNGYLFPFPHRRLVDLIIDKNRFNRFAMDNAISIPPTFFPDNIGDVEARASDLHYPCLIKPAVAGIPWREKGWKILLARNRSELLRTYQVAAAVQPLLVVQEVIEGPGSALHFSLTYADRGGECLTMFTGRKLRQHGPRCGISCLAESRWYPEVDVMTREILRKVGYSGYASIEFTQDARSGRFCVWK
jgi:predicted ATP-grasp superfamily ATP-dependent carboligase